MIRNYVLRNDLKDLVIEDDMIQTPMRADELAPPIGVSATDASYNVLPTGETLRTGDTRRNTNGRFNRGEHIYNKDSYSTEEYGWEEVSDNVSRLTNLEFFDDQLITTRLCNAVVMICREKRVVDAYQKTSAYPTANQLTATTAWSNKATASPKTDVNKMSLAAWKSFGVKKRGLQLTLTQDNVDAALDTDEVRKNASFTVNLDEYTYESAANYLARIWGIGKINVVSNTFNGGGIGGVWEAMEMWSNDGIMMHLPPTKVQTWKLPFFARQPVYTTFASDRLYETNEDWDIDAFICRVREYRGLKLNYKYGIILNGTLT